MVIMISLWACSISGPFPNVSPNPSPPSSPSLSVQPPISIVEDPGLNYDYVRRIRGLKHGDVVAYLTVPSLRLWHYPVRFGISQDILAKGPGLYPGSAAPGEGNFSMAGHRITPVGPFRTCSTGEWGTRDCHGPFRYVNELQRGDIAIVRYQGNTYTYRFMRTRVIDPDNIGILRDGRADMTFTACHPPGYATQRIIAQWKMEEKP